MSPVFALSTAAGVLIGLGVLVLLGLMFGVRNLQLADHASKSLQERIQPDRRPVEAAIRSDSESYRSRQGVHEPRARDARGRCAGAKRGGTAQQSAAANPSDAAAMRASVPAEGQVSGALGRLFALAESYPDLKANTNMLALQEELTSTENKVAFARQAFNDAVMSYNTRARSSPTRWSPASAVLRQPNSLRSSHPRNARHPKSSSDPDWRQQGRVVVRSLEFQRRLGHCNRADVSRLRLCLHGLLPKPRLRQAKNRAPGLLLRYGGHSDHSVRLPRDRVRFAIGRERERDRSGERAGRSVGFRNFSASWPSAPPL